MAHEGLHESKKDLRKQTRDLHRALVSLQEELEAVDWYRQRADACRDAQLKSILLHNMREEMEHAAMLIEWLQRDNPEFSTQLRSYLFSDRPITGIEENSAGMLDAGATEAPTIGALKE
jgi:ferritin-like protein